MCKERLRYLYLRRTKEAFGYKRYTKNVHRMWHAVVGEAPFLSTCEKCRIKKCSYLCNDLWKLMNQYANDTYKSKL